MFVHGLPNGYGWVGASHRVKDWTDGCIAVTNEEIEEMRRYGKRWRMGPRLRFGLRFQEQGSFR